MAEAWGSCLLTFPVLLKEESTCSSTASPLTLEKRREGLQVKPFNSMVSKNGVTRPVFLRVRVSVLFLFQEINYGLLFLPRKGSVCACVCWGGVESLDIRVWTSGCRLCYSLLQGQDTVRSRDLPHYPNVESSRKTFVSWPGVKQRSNLPTRAQNKLT